MAWVRSSRSAWIAVLALAASGCQLHKGRTDDGGANAATGGEPGGKPKIVFAETEYDVGTIDDSAPVSHEYKFKNAGDATLIIEKVGST